MKAATRGQCDENRRTTKSAKDENCVSKRPWKERPLAFFSPGGQLILAGGFVVLHTYVYLLDEDVVCVALSLSFALPPPV